MKHLWGGWHRATCLLLLANGPALQHQMWFTVSCQRTGDTCFSQYGVVFKMLSVYRIPGWRGQTSGPHLDLWASSDNLSHRTLKKVTGPETRVTHVKLVSEGSSNRWYNICLRNWKAFLHSANISQAATVWAMVSLPLKRSQSGWRSRWRIMKSWVCCVGPSSTAGKKGRLHPFCLGHHRKHCRE